MTDSLLSTTSIDMVDSGSDSDEPGLLLARLPLETRARRQPTTRAELPEELLAHIPDLSVLDNGLPYVNMAVASTSLVDTYFTRMKPSSLSNYADDASTGIGIQNSHHQDELSLGRTFAGRYKASRNNNPARTEMDFYVPPGLNINGVDTNHVIEAIRWGTVKDVSIGFYGGNLRCSIDGKLMLGDLRALLMYGDDDGADVRDPNAPCAHLPGFEYPVRDAGGRKTGDKALAIGEVDGAHCGELSFVFNGATPQAQIAGRSAPVFAKAMRMAEMEVLPLPIALALEGRFRGVRFPTITTKRFRGTRVNSEIVDSAALLESSPSAADSSAVSEGAVTNPPAEFSDTARSNAQRELEPLTGQKAGDRKVDDDRNRVDERAVVDEDDIDLSGRAKKTSPEQDSDADDQKRTDSNNDDDDDKRAKAKKTDGMAERESSGGSGAEAARAAEAVSNPSSSRTVAVTDALQGVRQALVSAGLAPEGFSGNVAMRFAEISREMTSLREWADVGQQARDKLIEDCRKAGVRAFGGTSFNESAYGPILTRGSFTELQALHAHLEEQGRRRFIGGRGTQDEQPEPIDDKTPAPARKVPARAFRA